MAQKRSKDSQNPESGTVAEAPYQVVARRFRPQSFGELVGQDEVLHSLRTALQQQRVPHAFLFSGSRGVGKTTSARILARCLNCEQGPTPEPCGKCSACLSILDGSNPDVMEIDAASNNAVDDVRRLRESVGFATMQSRYRVVILDEVHMMSKSAFNAFLKTLEEPPPRVVFVLATTELHKVPETIRSRCQVLLFRRVGEPDLQRRLRTIADKEGVTVPEDVLAEIAASVRGGVRDAETALERVLPLVREMGQKFDLAAYRTLVARVGTDAVVEVVAALLQGDARQGLHFANDLSRHGTDEREALGEIVDVLRWLLLLKVDGDDSGLVPLTGRLRERLQELSAPADTARLDAMVGAGLLARDRLRRLEDRGAVFEVALVRMAQAGQLPTLADLLAEVRAGGLAAGPASSGAAAASPASRPRSQPPRSAPPRPVTPPAPPPRPVAPVTDAKDLKSRTLVRLEDRKLLQATVELCRVEGPDDQGRVVVTLETERKMHRDRLQSPVVQQEIVKAFQDAVGRPVQVEVRIASSASGGAAPSAPQVKPGNNATRVLKAFRGRVEQVDPPDRLRQPEAASPDIGDEVLDADAPPAIEQPADPPDPLP